MIAINRILCPVDMSESSRAALAQAANLAHGYDATLTVLAVVGVSEVPLGEAPPSVRGLTVEARAKLLASLEQFSAPVIPAGVSVDYQLEEGEVVHEIVRASEEQAPDLLVLGTHGRGGFQQFILGSVVNKVLRRVACPLLTVPPGARAPVEDPAGFKTVLCGHDLSDAATHALSYALLLAQEAGGRLLLQHVVEWPIDTQVSPRFDALRAEMVASARERLQAAVPADAGDWCQPEIVVTPGRAASGIVALAEAEQADLIVLGVTARSAIDRALNGTTAYQIIRTAPCSVLTVRSGDDR